jgi:hypothetical protein
MRRAPVVTLIVAVLALAGCGSGNDYPKEAREDIIRTCMTAALEPSEAYCRCGLENLELMPYEEFERVERARSEGHPELVSEESRRKPAAAVADCWSRGRLKRNTHGRAARIFLPFADDDPKTAEVLSKVLLLARDEEIKDPTILKQLRSG